MLRRIAASEPAIQYYPIFLDLTGRRALVVGQGEAASRKAEALAGAGAVIVAAPRFAPGLLQGCVLAIGADAPEADLQALSRAAREACIPVNIVDRPELCSFITPAIVDRAPITVAVSSGGAAPVLAREVRARIEALLPPALGRVASLLDSLKGELRARFDDLGARRRVIQRLLAGPAAALALAGRAGDARLAATREMEAGETRPPGIVFLVGAGPGAGDLLTLRAQRLLGEADVIVHDRLIGDDVLDMARRDATRIFAGKQRANHCMAQEDINALLVRLAREGRRVVRLKGGDPFVFGRGGEEAEALAAAGIAFEVVPGVTAALACAAQTAIPLTHRAVARTVTLATGHTREGVLDLDFASLASLGGTLAIYMGVVSLPLLTRGLIAYGMSGQTACALIERGGTDRQRVLRSRLDEVADLAPGWSTGGPTLVLIGEVVGRQAEAESLAREPAAVDGERRAGDGGGGVGA